MKTFYLVINTAVKVGTESISISGKEMQAKVFIGSLINIAKLNITRVRNKLYGIVLNRPHELRFKNYIKNYLIAKTVILIQDQKLLIQ